MNKVIPWLLSGCLLVTVAACNNNAKTSSDAPNSTDNNGKAPSADAVQNNQKDAMGQTRRNQLNSDIRAREQRNTAMGDQSKRADGDLESEVRSKLEANIPNGKLTVDSKQGNITVAGSVPTQAQFDKIEPLAKEINGVKTVAVKATVAPAQTK